MFLSVKYLRRAFEVEAICLRDTLQPRPKQQLHRTSKVKLTNDIN